VPAVLAQCPGKVVVPVEDRDAHDPITRRG
jgi:hypothetical protein